MKPDYILKNSCSQAFNKGQALPIGLALLAFSIFSGFILFNTAQVSTDKMRLSNAADAAAYSGLLWQARAMNFQSYTNRAMVANQVSIAQAVTLHSWINYASVATDNVNTVLGGLPFVGTVTQALNATVDTVEPVITAVAENLVVAADQVNGSLSHAQEIMHLTGFSATPEIITNVARANDPSFRTDSLFALSGLTENQQGWDDFTETYDSSDSDAIGQRADIIRRSRGEFTTRRDWEFLPFWFYTTPLTRHKIYKRGATEIVFVPTAESELSVSGNHAEQGHWEWKAKDTLSLQNRIWRPFRGTKRVEVPIGWAESFANTDPQAQGSIEPCVPDDDRGFPTDDGCPKWLGANKYAERLAKSNSSNLQHRYNGIRAFRDLKNFPSQARDPRLSLRIEVYSPEQNTVTTSTGLGIGSFFSDDSVFARNELAAIAGSELYFHHPEIHSHSQRTEFANTYNPYWDVRLKALSARERLAAVLYRAPGLFSGGSSAPQPGGASPDNERLLSTSGSNAQLHSDDSSAHGYPSLPAYPGPSNSATTGTGALDADSFFTSTESGFTDYQLPPNGSHFVLAALHQSPEIALSLDWIEQDFGIVGIDPLNPQSSAQRLLERMTVSLAEDAFSDQVEQVIDDAVKRLITAALQGVDQRFDGFASDIQASYENLEGLAHSTAEHINTTIDTVTTTIENTSAAIESEAVQIRERISTRLDNELVILDERIMNEIGDIDDYVGLLEQLDDPDLTLNSDQGHNLIENILQQPGFDELNIDLAVDLVEEDIEILAGQIESLLSEKDEIQESLPTQQAQLLVDIVNQEANQFDIDLPTAQRVLELINLSEEPIDLLSVISGDQAVEEDEYSTTN